MAKEIDALLRQAAKMNKELAAEKTANDIMARLDMANNRNRGKPATPKSAPPVSRTQAAVIEMEAPEAPSKLPPSGQPKQVYAGKATVSPTTRGDIDFWQPKNASPAPVKEFTGARAQQFIASSPSQPALTRRATPQRKATVAGSDPATGRVFVRTRMSGARLEDLLARERYRNATPAATAVTPEAPAVQQATRQQARTNPPAVAQAQAVLPSSQTPPRTRGAQLVQQAGAARRAARAAGTLPPAPVAAPEVRMATPTPPAATPVAATPSPAPTRTPARTPRVAPSTTPTRTPRAPRINPAADFARMPVMNNPTRTPRDIPASRGVQELGRIGNLTGGSTPVTPTPTPTPPKPMGIGRFYGGSLAVGLGIGLGQGAVHEYTRYREQKRNK